jgi:hypothetical protein
VTLGEKPTVADIVGKIDDLIVMLSDGPRIGFVSLAAATTRLTEVLGERRLLLLVDDVWDAAHLTQFLHGARQSVRLITTRNRDTLPAKTHSEATQLFQAIYAQIQARPADASVETDEIQEKVQQIEQETKAGAQANEGKLGRWLRELARMVPDIFDVAVACLTNPLAGFAEIVKKVAAKAREILSIS